MKICFTRAYELDVDIDRLREIYKEIHKIGLPKSVELELLSSDYLKECEENIELVSEKPDVLTEISYIAENFIS